MVTDSQVGPGQEPSGYKETERNLKGVCVCVCVTSKQSQGTVGTAQMLSPNKFHHCLGVGQHFSCSQGQLATG